MYNKRKQKVKFKIRPEFIAILLIVATFIGLSIGLRLPDASTKFANNFVEAGASLSNEHVYDEMNFDELTKHIKNSDELVFVFVGSVDCETTVAQISTINSAAYKWDVEKVIYLDVSFVIPEHEEDSKKDKAQKEEIERIEEALKNIGKDAEVKTDANLDSTPALWVFEDNKLIFNSSDFLDEDNEEDEYEMYLSWSQIADRAFCVNLPLFGTETE